MLFPPSHEACTVGGTISAHHLRDWTGWEHDRKLLTHCLTVQIRMILRRKAGHANQKLERTVKHHNSIYKSPTHPIERQDSIDGA